MNIDGSNLAADHGDELHIAALEIELDAMRSELRRANRTIDDLRRRQACVVKILNDMKALPQFGGTTRMINEALMHLEGV